MDENVQDLIQRGIDAMDVKQYEVALGQFERARGLDPRNIEVYLHIGNAYMNLEQTEKAIESFRRALLLDENNLQALYSMGCAYFLADDPANAIRFFNKVEERGGATTDMYLIESTLFMDAEDYNMAIRVLNRAIKLEPLNADITITKAETYVVMGRIDDAVSTLHDLQELLPDEIEAYTAEVQVLLDADRADDSLVPLDRAQQRFPGDVALMTLRAKALNNLGRYEEALKVASKALATEGLSEAVKSEAQMQQSIALAGTGNFEDAAAVLEGSAKEGNASESFYILMNEALVLQKYDRVLESSEELLAMDNVTDRIKAAAYFNRAFATEKLEGIDAAQEAYAEAALYLRRITIAHPNLFEVYAYRVLSHKALSQFDEALDIADYLISLDPSAAASYAIKSDVLRSQGNYEEADKLRTRVLQLDSSFHFGE